MPLTLCIETATHLCSVALVDGERLIASRDEEARERFTHAERLGVLVDEVMGEAHHDFNELSAVAVGIGPGSYTGLRIGLSAAKGYCYALEIPIIGIGTLETLVSTLHASRSTLHGHAVLHPMIDARRMEVFTQAFDGTGRLAGELHAKVLDEPWIAALEPGMHHIVFGDGADKATELWKSHPAITYVPHVKPSAKAMAPMAIKRLAEERFEDLAYLVPMYGKEAGVTQAKK